MGWFNDTYVTNTFAPEEIKLIAVVLIAMAVLLVALLIFRAYHNHVKALVKNTATREVKLTVS